VNSSRGRIAILLAMLLFGAECACASIHHTGEAENAVAVYAPVQSVRLAKSDVFLPSTFRIGKTYRSASVSNVDASVDLLSRHCVLLI
jgi:hypothetical protein